MAEVGTAYVTIVPTFKGGVRDIEGQLNGQMGAAGAKGGKRFSAAFKGGVAGGLAGLATGKVVGKAFDFMKQANAEAREAQKVTATTAQIIKSTGGVANVSAAGVSRLSEAISNKTGVDDEAIQTGANLLLTFKNVRNEAGKGNKVFDQATKAAVDLSAAGFGSIDSASKMLGKALNDPVKGMTALSRAGVTFTEGQKDQVEQMVKSGDLLGAQKVILGEVQSQVGGVAAASSTAGEKLTTAFNNFKESIGTALLPVIDAAAAKITPFLTKLSNNRPVLIGLAAIVGGILVGAFVALAVSVIAATWPFILAGAAIAALTLGFVWAYKHSEVFRTVVRALGAAVLTMASIILNVTSKLALGWAWMLEKLSKVPGFGWAAGAAKGLRSVAEATGAASDKTGQWAKNLNKTPAKKNVEVKSTNLDKPVKDSKTLGANIKAIPGAKKIGITTPSLTTPIKDTGKLASGIKDIPGSKKTAYSTSGVSDFISDARNAKAAVDDVPTKHNTHYTSSGSSSAPGTAVGGIFHKAAIRMIGEDGPEAVVPLNRPLNQVDPAVRWLSAYAQGKTDLSGVGAMPLDGAGLDRSSSGTSDVVPVRVVNPNEVAEGTRRVARSEIESEKAFAGTTGRMG